MKTYPGGSLQAKLAQMLSDGHELLREILMNQVDYYKVCFWRCLGLWFGLVCWEEPLGVGSCSDSSTHTPQVGSALMPIHDKLENCLHALREIKNSPDELKPKQLRPYRSKLAEIDAHYEQARYVGRLGSEKGAAATNRPLALD